MTHEEIIAMAREAEISLETMVLLCGVEIQITESPLSVDELARFADRVAAKEREACAQVCDAERQDFGGVAAGPMTTDAGKRVHEAMAAGAATCAAAIRARGTEEGA